MAICLIPFSAAVLLAQGPPPGGGRFGGPLGLDGPAGFAGWGGGLMGAGPGSRAIVTNAPYSATETITRQQTLADGNTISTKGQSNVYRDSQGRIRTEETITPPASSGKAAFTVITIFDPVGGYGYMLDSSTMTAWQSALPKSTSATPPARPANSNVTTTDLGTSTINNEQAKGTQIAESIPAGAIGNAQAIQVSRVAWVSTVLSVPVQIKTIDPRNGVSDMELTNIVHSEPGAALFLVPAGYTVKQGGSRGPGGPGGSGRPGPPPQ
ncbi:MAG: hypothetical protein M3N93_05395 [Acidobacteriota bacterium]|nr:hypothetical protein [Acidobacteriota bacterium]